MRTGAFVEIFLCIILWASVAKGGDTKVGVVDYIEGGRVYLSRVGNVTPVNGERLEIFDYDGKRVATIRIEKISGDQIVCSVIRGDRDISPGYAARTRRPLKRALFIEGYSFPVDVLPNPQYTRVTGRVSDISGERGMAFSIGAIVRPDDKGKFIQSLPPYLRLPIMFQVSASYCDYRLFEAIEIINLGPIIRLEIVPEKFRLELAGGVGFGLAISKFEWARDTTATYGDSIEGNSGTAELGNVYTFRGSAGLHYQVTREFGLFVRVGYYGFSYEEPMADNRPSGSGYNSGYDIPESWWESTLGSQGGLSFQAGWQYWFKL